jgi:hypothetical protein
MVSPSTIISANQKDQKFITPKKVFQSEQKHSWIKERLISHKKP